jgi:polysaccharide biosynthesis/export protein
MNYLIREHLFIRHCAGRAILLLVVSTTVFAYVVAQTPNPLSVNGTKPLSGHESAESLYRIGPGDVLDIRVFSRPQLSRESVRVDVKGTIQMPWISSEILAACRTERELTEDITSLYRRYLRSPQVDVFIKEYNSKPVAVIGAVNAPGRFQLQRQVRLVELLTFVNGPAERAGRFIQIIHASDFVSCRRIGISDTKVGLANEDESITSLALDEVLRSKREANPVIEPGDIVTVLDAEQIYIVGNVNKPVSLPLRSTVTISQAIAMAGGLLPDTRKEKVRIIRQTDGGRKEIYVDLTAIDKRQADDIALQANDIIDVPSSNTTGKKVLRGIMGSFFPALGQLPVRVVR